MTNLIFFLSSLAFIVKHNEFYSGRAILFRANDINKDAIKEFSTNSIVPKQNFKGFYRRPSKAVELGGGFFVPGLENERIRLISGIVLLFATYINHSSPDSTSSLFQSISEIVGVVCSFMLFLQGYFPNSPSTLSTSSNFVALQSETTSTNLSNLAMTTCSLMPNIAHLFALHNDSIVVDIVNESFPVNQSRYSCQLLSYIKYLNLPPNLSYISYKVDALPPPLLEYITNLSLNKSFVALHVIKDLKKDISWIVLTTKSLNSDGREEKESINIRYLCQLLCAPISI